MRVGKELLIVVHKQPKHFYSSYFENLSGFGVLCDASYTPHDFQKQNKRLKETGDSNLYRTTTNDT